MRFGIHQYIMLYDGLMPFWSFKISGSIHKLVRVYFLHNFLLFFVTFSSHMDGLSASKL